MAPVTHARIDPAWSGSPVLLQPGRAVLEMDAAEAMRADEHGLVHGGFVFSLADHAAMLAINRPTVVLGSAEARFLAPVRVGETLRAEAIAEPAEGTKLPVRVTVTASDDDEERRVLDGRFICFTPARHVLDD